MNWRHTVGIGVMMNTRGLTEVVVLNIAKDAGILDEQLFTALVLMAVITTAMAGPLLSVIFPPRQLVLEKQRDVAAAAAARGGALDESTARIVVLVHEVRRGSKLLEAAVSTLTSPHLRAHLVRRAPAASSFLVARHPLCPLLRRSQHRLSPLRAVFCTPLVREPLRAQPEARRNDSRFRLIPPDVLPAWVPPARHGADLRAFVCCSSSSLHAGHRAVPAARERALPDGARHGEP